MGLLNFVAWLINGALGSNTSVTTSVTTRVWSSDDADMPLDALTAEAGVSAPDAPSVPMWQHAKDQIASLQKIDPDFSDVAFLGQASKTYAAALQAEGDMNPAELGAAASADFVQQLSQRIAAWQSAGLVRHVSDVKLDPPMIFKISIDGTQQLITVRFTGTITRYTADASNCVVTDGNKQTGYFTEFAIFVRPAGTTTPKAVGAGAPSHCPGCGAPVEPGLAACPYCNTPLTGTGANWQIDRLSASPYN